MLLAVTTLVIATFRAVGAAVWIAMGVTCLMLRASVDLFLKSSCHYANLEEKESREEEDDCCTSSYENVLRLRAGVYDPVSPFPVPNVYEVPKCGA